MQPFARRYADFSGLAVLQEGQNAAKSEQRAYEHPGKQSAPLVLGSDHRTGPLTPFTYSNSVMAANAREGGLRNHHNLRAREAPLLRLRIQKTDLALVPAGLQLVQRQDKTHRESLGFGIKPILDHERFRLEDHLFAAVKTHERGDRLCHLGPWFVRFQVYIHILVLPKDPRHARNELLVIQYQRVFGQQFLVFFSSIEGRIDRLAFRAQDDRTGRERWQAPGKIGNNKLLLVSPHFAGFILPNEKFQRLSSRFERKARAIRHRPPG